MSQENSRSRSSNLIEREAGRFQRLVSYFQHDPLLRVYGVRVVFREAEETCVKSRDVLSQEVTPLCDARAALLGW
jgi:hypothetical protein